MVAWLYSLLLMCTSLNNDNPILLAVVADLKVALSKLLLFYYGYCLSSLVGGVEIICKKPRSQIANR